MKNNEKAASGQEKVFLKKFFPPLQWWPAVSRRSMRADIIAGITGAIIVLPQGVAFAIIAPDPDSKRKSFINIEKKPLPECPQLKIIRIDGSIFFGEAVTRPLEKKTFSTQKTRQ